MNEWFEAEEHIEKAHQWLEAGLLEDALRELRIAITVNPFHGDWHFYMGMVLSNMGRYEEALESYRKAMGCDHHEFETYLQAGYAALQCGRPEAAIDYLEKAEKIEPGEVDVYGYRIAAYTEMKAYDDAELMFYLALQLDEVPATIWSYMGQCQLAQKKGRKALDCFEKADHLDPFLKGIAGNMGRAWLQVGDVDEAQRCFRRQLREEPTNVDMLTEFGQLLLELDRMPEAESKFTRAVELDPDHAGAHYYIGLIAMRHHLLDRAQMEFELVVRLDRKHRFVHLKLGEIALRQGRVHQAQMYLLEALDRLKRERDGGPREDLANLLIDAGMPNHAADVYEQMLKRRPGDGRLMESRAMALYKADRFAEGVRVARRAFELQPGCERTVAGMVFAHLQLNQLGRALYWLRCLEEQAPGYEEMWRLRWLVFTARLRKFLKLG